MNIPRAFVIDPEGTIHKQEKSDQEHLGIIMRIKGIPDLDIDDDYGLSDDDDEIEYYSSIVRNAMNQGWIRCSFIKTELYFELAIPNTSKESFLTIRRIVRTLSDNVRTVVIDKYNPSLSRSEEYSPSNFLKLYKTGIYRLIRPTNVARIRALESKTLIEELVKSYLNLPKRVD